MLFEELTDKTRVTRIVLPMDGHWRVYSETGAKKTLPPPAWFPSNGSVLLGPCRIRTDDQVSRGGIPVRREQADRDEGPAPLKPSTPGRPVKLAAERDASVWRPNPRPHRRCRQHQS